MCLGVQESEYAAWVLVNGFALNHMTVSVHRLHGFKSAPTPHAGSLPAHVHPRAAAALLALQCGNAWQHSYLMVAAGAEYAR